MAAEARCATHSDVVAAGVCARCGSFLCAACRVHDAPVHCAACHARWFGRLSTEPFSLGLVIEEGFRLYRENVLVVLALSGISALADAGLHAALDLHFENPTPRQLLLSVAPAGVLELMLSSLLLGLWLPLLFDRIKQERRPLEEGLRLALQRWPRLVWARVRFALAFWLGLGLCLVPGLLWGGRYVLVEEVAMFESQPVFSRAGQLASEHTWPLVGLVAITTAAQLAMGVVGSTLQTYTGFSSSLASDFGRTLLGYGIDAILVCCYASLSAPRPAGA